MFDYRLSTPFNEIMGHEQPPGIGNIDNGYTVRKINRSDLLPTWATGRCELLDVIPENNVSVDPFILYDRWGAILYQWPDNYTPTLSEVSSVCDKYHHLIMV